MESRLFEFTPELAPGAGLAPTHAASKAAELLFIQSGNKEWWIARDLRPAQPVKSRLLKLSELAIRNWGLQPVMLRPGFATREARSLLPEGVVGRHGFAPCSRRLRAGTSLSKFATRTRREGGVEPPPPGL